MSVQPSLDVLKGKMHSDVGVQEPLHSQLRRALRETIDEYFTDGQRFWPESALIQHLGISQITVRRALQGLAQEGILERCPPKGSFVRKASESETWSIGCFVPQYDSEIWNEILQHLAMECRQNKTFFQTHLTHRGEHVQDLRRHLALAKGDERYVVIGSTVDEVRQLWDVLDDKGYRPVCIETPASNRAAHFVGVDNARGIRMALEHLRELGHRRVVFLANEPLEHPSVMAREAAFLQVTAEWGWTESRVIECKTKLWEDAYLAAKNAMPEVWEHRPTAILAVSTGSGALAAQHWFAEREISVPRQVSVIGFDDIPSARHVYPPLTTVAHPLQSIARWTIELLINPPSTPQKILLEPRLIVRRSTDVVGR
jgi:LacI family transcriptional regulator